MRQLRQQAAWVWVLLLLAACEPALRPAALPTGDEPEDFPGALYQQGFVHPGQVYRIDPETSDLRILVYRGGELARLGHNHVIASRDLQGFVFVAEAEQFSRFDLFLPVDRLVVDEPLHRSEAGAEFQSLVSEESAAKTRRNMLGDKVLDAPRYPFVSVQGRPSPNGSKRQDMVVTIALHGVIHELDIKPSVSITAGRLVADGRFTLNQSDFAITPFSALLGRLRVEDQLSINYHLTGIAVAQEM